MFRLSRAAALIFLLTTALSFGASFGDGNLVIYRTGDGVTPLANTGSPVFLDEYTPTGTLVQSIPVPTAANGANRPLVASGTAQSEGLIARSLDGRYVLLTGYDSVLPGSGSLSSMPAATIHRVVGRVDATGAIDTTTSLSDAADADNVRSATSTNGTDLWVTGASGGVRYTTLGATTSTQISDTITNLRQLQIDTGQLYASSQSGTDIRVGTVGTGIPATPGQIIKNLKSVGDGNQPNGFVLADLSGEVDGVDTLYICDETDGGKIQKFTLVAGSWVKSGAVAAAGVRSIAVTVVGTTATLYAVAGGDGSASGVSALYRLIDSGGYAGQLSGDVTTLVTFKDGARAFRGVALAPTNNLNTAPKAGPIAALANAIGDPTNPGVTFAISDAQTAPANLKLSVISSTNVGVAPLGRIGLFNNNNGTATLRVIPGAVGYSTITIRVTDPGGLFTTVTCEYAASERKLPTTRYHISGSDISAATAIDGQFMIAANDEDQILRVFDRKTSGVPVAQFNMAPGQLQPPLQLAQVDAQSTLYETDLEACVRVGNRIYWIGSHDNNKDGELRPNRSRLFAIDISGTGAQTQISFAGRYDHLRADLIQWDNSGAHGKGAGYYQFAAGTAAGVSPEDVTRGGFNIEGLCMAPGSTSTAYVCFRAPIVPPGNRNLALIVPVLNFDTLAVIGGPEGLSGGNAGSAVFGTPIEVDLGGRGFRDIQKNANEEYLLIAGPASDVPAAEGPHDFVLYTWNGQPNTAPVVHVADLRGMHPEAIVEVPTPLTADSIIQLVSDNGDTVWYDDGIIGKHLPQQLHKKSRSDLVRLGETGPMLQSLTVTPPNPVAGDVVTFDAVLADQSTLVSYDFGDGSVSPAADGPGGGWKRQHVFATEGVYTITLTATLQQQSITSTYILLVSKLGDGLTPLPLTITKVTAKFNFLKTRVDLISIAGTLPAGIKLGKTDNVWIDAGGISAHVKPKPPRSSPKNPVVQFTGSFSLSAKGAFKIKLSKGTFLPFLRDEGFGSSPADAGTHTIVLGIQIVDKFYQGQLSVNYQVKGAASGFVK